MKRLALITCFIGAALLATVSYADDIFCKLTPNPDPPPPPTDPQPVPISGGSTDVRHRDWFDVLSVASGVMVPLDDIRLPTGDPQPQPLKIILLNYKATPRLFSAAINNERLSVVCEFVPILRGNNRANFRITLDGAKIIDIALTNNSSANSGGNETIQFYYETIHLDDVSNNPSNPPSVVFPWQET